MPRPLATPSDRAESSSRPLLQPIWTTVLPGMANDFRQAATVGSNVEKPGEAKPRTSLSHAGPEP
jgi:hypothetical protein